MFHFSFFLSFILYMHTFISIIIIISFYLVFFSFFSISILILLNDFLFLFNFLNSDFCNPCWSCYSLFARQRGCTMNFLLTKKNPSYAFSFRIKLKPFHFDSSFCVQTVQVWIGFFSVCFLFVILCLLLIFLLIFSFQLYLK